MTAGTATPGACQIAPGVIQTVTPVPRAELPLVAHEATKEIIPMTSELADGLAAEVEDAAVIRLRESSKAALWHGKFDVAETLDRLADDLENTTDRIGGAQ
ncbi:hypothetical protein Ntsu_04240 [Nocardia sp. IFM 10818]